MTLAMDVRYKRAAAAKRMKTLQPAQKTAEACKKLGLPPLPPIRPSVVHHHPNKNTKYKKLKKQNAHDPPLRPAVMFGQSLMDYVAKPSYFCHPVVVPNIAPNAGAAKHVTANFTLSPTSGNRSLSKPTAKVDLAKDIQTDNPPRADDELGRADARNVAKQESLQKFFDFCKREGFDAVSSEFTKAVSTFKNAKKYSHVSKATALTPLREGVYDVTVSNAYLARPQRNETIRSTRRRRSSSERRTIKENARASANKGLAASTKAVMFILREVRNHPVLPPINSMTSSEGS